MPLNIRIQWNAGTACVSECVLKTPACRGLLVGPSKVGNLLRGVSAAFLGSRVMYDLLRNQEKGVLAKGVSKKSTVTAKERKNTQGYWPQQHIWHSHRHSQDRCTFCRKPLLKTPFSWFLTCLNQDGFDHDKGQKSAIS